VHDVEKEMRRRTPRRTLPARPPRTRRTAGSAWIAGAAATPARWASSLRAALTSATACRARTTTRIRTSRAPRGSTGGPTTFPFPGLTRPRGPGDPRAPFAPWGRDDSLGNDPEGARGHMWGEDTAHAYGSSGLEFGRGVGRRLLPGSVGGRANAVTR